jgi:hypothetical protein
LSVLWTGAPNCLVCHRTEFGVPCPYEDEPATLGKTEARSAIIHRTVRYATGLSSESAGNDYLRATVDSAKVNSAATVQHRSQSRKSEGHRTVRCRKKTKLQRSTLLWTLTVG